MKIRFIRISAVIAALAAEGCVFAAAETTPPAQAEPQAKAAETAKTVPDPVFPAALEPEARAAAEKLANGMAEALRSGDFKPFLAAQPQGGRRMNAEAFSRIRNALTRHYGQLTGAEFFGRLDQGKVMDFLWKFTFESAASGAKAPRRHEIIYWVRVGSAGGKPVVAGFSFNFY